MSTRQDRSEVLAHQSTDGTDKNTPDPRNEREIALGLQEVEPFPEPVGGVQLLQDLRDLIKRCVVLPPMAAETLALACSMLLFPAFSLPFPTNSALSLDTVISASYAPVDDSVHPVNRC